jgi:hypothetical protein
MTNLQADLAQVAQVTIQSMHKDGMFLDPDEIHAAIVHTFKHHQLDAETLTRLRVQIERWIAKVTQP